MNSQINGVSYQEIRQNIKSKRFTTSNPQEGDEISKLNQLVHQLKKGTQEKDSRLQNKDLQILQLKNQIKTFFNNSQERLSLPNSNNTKQIVSIQKLQNSQIDYSSVQQQKEKLVEYKLQQMEAMQKTSELIKRTDELQSINVQQKNEIQKLKKQVEEYKTNQQVLQLQKQQQKIEQIELENNELKTQLTQYKKQSDEQIIEIQTQKQQEQENKNVIDELKKTVQQLKAGGEASKHFNEQLSSRIMEVNQQNFQLKRDINRISVDQQMGYIQLKNSSVTRVSQQLIKSSLSEEDEDQFQLTDVNINKQNDTNEIQLKEVSQHEQISVISQTTEESEEFEKKQQVKESTELQQQQYHNKEINNVSIIKNIDFVTNYSVLLKLEQQLVNNEQFIKNRTKIQNLETHSQRVFNNPESIQSIIGTKGNDVARLHQVVHENHCQIDSILPESSQQTVKIRNLQLNIE